MRPFPWDEFQAFDKAGTSFLGFSCSRFPQLELAPHHLHLSSYHIISPTLLSFSVISFLTSLLFSPLLFSPLLLTSPFFPCLFLSSPHLNFLFPPLSTLISFPPLYFPFLSTPLLTFFPPFPLLSSPLLSSLIFSSTLLSRDLLHSLFTIYCHLLSPLYFCLLSSPPFSIFFSVLQKGPSIHP